MDEEDLLFFTMRKMDDMNSASCDKPAPHTSRNKRKVADDSSNKATKSKNDQYELQEEMTSNVTRISNSMEQVAYVNLVSQKEALEQKKLDLQLKKLDPEYASTQAQQLIDGRIRSLDHTIRMTVQQIDASAVGPRRINFDQQQSSSVSTPSIAAASSSAAAASANANGASSASS